MKSFSRALHLLAICVSALAAFPAWADPPERVGRISLLAGPVYLRNEYYAENQNASLNWPVTAGDTLSTAAGSRAEVRIGSTAIRLDGGSEIEFAALDDMQLRLRLLRGTVAVRVRDAEQARQFALATPQGSFALSDAGAYRFETGWRTNVSAAVVFKGAAVFDGSGLTLGIGFGQRAEIVGEQNLGYAITPLAQDAFDLWSLARDRRDDQTRSVRYVSREMTGYEDLDGYGDWRESAEYGPVWYPRVVAAGWAPYRSGRWVWVEPWGWTWLDEAPWGFAPFHYGRWQHIGGVWAWVPGPVMLRPVYAPALVAWVGRPGWQLSFSFGTGSAVGWFPLGPREVYVPAFRCSSAFVQRINAPHVSDAARIAAVQREPLRVQYVNRAVRDAVTIVPTQVVSGGTPVSRQALPQARALVSGALPEVAPAPQAAPARWRQQAAAPEPRSVAPARPANAADAGAGDERRGARRRETETGVSTSRPVEVAPAAPRESRSAFVPPPAAAPAEVRRSTRQHEAERAAPQRRMDTAAPAERSSARNGHDMPRPPAEVREARRNGAAYEPRPEGRERRPEGHDGERGVRHGPGGAN